MTQQSDIVNALAVAEDERRADAAAAEALGELYRRYAGWLRALLRRRYGADADDLVQETYIRIAPYHATQEIRHPQALLMRIASNLARNQLRRESNGRRLNALLVEERIHVGHAVAPDQFEALLFKQIVLELPMIYRDVMILSRFSGLTNDEIARSLGLSIKTVEWRISRAVALCAKRTSE